MHFWFKRGLKNPQPSDLVSTEESVRDELKTGRRYDPWIEPRYRGLCDRCEQPITLNSQYEIGLHLTSYECAHCGHKHGLAEPSTNMIRMPIQSFMATGPAAS